LAYLSALKGGSNLGLLVVAIVRGFGGVVLSVKVRWSMWSLLAAAALNVVGDGGLLGYNSITFLQKIYDIIVKKQESCSHVSQLESK
jgi:hypothetical protein